MAVLKTVELKKNMLKYDSFRESNGEMMLKITPGKPGTSKQFHRAEPKRRRALQHAFSAPAAIENTFVIYPAQSARAAWVLYSIIQARPQNLSYRGGYWRKNQNVQPRPYPQCGSRRLNAGIQSTLFYIFGGKK